MTEERIPLRMILDQVKTYLKDNGVRVPDPFKAYYDENMYVPQIGVYGWMYWYQLPNKGKIIAYWDHDTVLGRYVPEGVDRQFLIDTVNGGRDVWRSNLG